MDFCREAFLPRVHRVNTPCGPSRIECEIIIDVCHIQIQFPNHLIPQLASMSLPVVKTLADCADYHKTVLPYIPQLYDLPQQIFQNVNNLQALKVLYIATNPLMTALAFSLFLAPIFLIISEFNKNYSQVDRCWSILPTLYNAHFVLYAHAAGLPTKRLDVLMLFSCVWSVNIFSTSLSKIPISDFSRLA